MKKVIVAAFPNINSSLSDHSWLTMARICKTLCAFSSPLHLLFPLVSGIDDWIDMILPLDWWILDWLSAARHNLPDNPNCSLDNHAIPLDRFFSSVMLSRIKAILESLLLLHARESTWHFNDSAAGFTQSSFEILEFLGNETSPKLVLMAIRF